MARNTELRNSFKELVRLAHHARFSEMQHVEEAVRASVMQMDALLQADGGAKLFTAKFSAMRDARGDEFADTRKLGEFLAKLRNEAYAQYNPPFAEITGVGGRGGR